MDPFDFNWFMLCSWAMSFFQKLCPAPFPPVLCSSPEPCQAHNVAFTINLRDNQDSWPLGKKCCILSNLSRYPSSMFPTTCATTASPSEPNRVGDRHTMPARSPSVGGIPSRTIGLPDIMFATLGLSSAGHSGPNPYHPSPKVTNIPRDQISTPFLWNIWFVVLIHLFLSPLWIPTTLPPLKAT